MINVCANMENTLREQRHLPQDNGERSKKLKMESKLLFRNLQEILVFDINNDF